MTELENVTSISPAMAVVISLTEKRIPTEGYESGDHFTLNLGTTFKSGDNNIGRILIALGAESVWTSIQRFNSDDSSSLSFEYSFIEETTYIMCEVR